jgi:hypothetical protein
VQLEHFECVKMLVDKYRGGMVGLTTVEWYGLIDRWEHTNVLVEMS